MPVILRMPPGSYIYNFFSYFVGPFSDVQSMSKIHFWYLIVFCQRLKKNNKKALQGSIAPFSRKIFLSSKDLNLPLETVGVNIEFVTLIECWSRLFSTTVGRFLPEQGQLLGDTTFSRKLYCKFSRCFTPLWSEIQAGLRWEQSLAHPAWLLPGIPGLGKLDKFEVDCTFSSSLF